MKLCLVLATLFVFSFTITESKPEPSWLPRSIYDSVSNITNYVREKGRGVKQFYQESVKNKFISYYNKTKRFIMENEYSPKSKFKEYVDSAEKTGSNVFDAIASRNIEYQCLEDDPIVHMTTPQLIAMNDYPVESHTIKTDDGYLLTLHRIPYSKMSSQKLTPRKTVFLHHGILGSSADWVIPGPQKGLAYILSDAGYDVWMANVRGNFYSRAHVSRNVDTFAFWNFTWHEVSQHDLPAAIDYVMLEKGFDVKINYVGHSMGTTVLFALLSTKHEYNKVLRAGFALAPVAYMSNIKSPIHLLSKFANNIEYLMKILGANEFLPQNAILRWLSKHACEINHYEEFICENSMFVLCGHDESQFNRTLLPLILGHVPAGASTKSLIHYAQEIRNAGRFQQFDYGTEGNLKQYGAPVPPEYPLHQITLPIALLSADNDWLASEIDVTNLFLQLAKPIEHYVVPLKQFNHIDFLWAVDAPKLVYKKLLQLMEEGTDDTFMYNEIETSRV